MQESRYSFIASSLNELEDDCATLLMHNKGNAIVIFSAIMDEEDGIEDDLFVVTFRDFELSMDEWERIERYIASPRIRIRLTVYPLNGTRYLIQYDNSVAGDGVNVIRVIPEHEVEWVQ